MVIKDKALAYPVVITGNGYSRLPPNWNIQQGSRGLEITNENNIPVLILQYSSPYEITISGLFVTPLGVLKVDNSDNIIFEIGDSPFELESYKVNKALYPRSIFDLLKSERTYNLRSYKEMMPFKGVMP